MSFRGSSMTPPPPSPPVSNGGSDVLDFSNDQASKGADFGVGIVIETITDGKEHDVAIKDLVAHGSADRDGTLEKGDRILMIGDLDAHELVNSAGADTGMVFRKHLKGPSGSHVSLQIRKPSGQVKTVRLERGNAGYWAIYDQLHKANLEVVSLRRELSDAQVAAEKATTMLQLARAETSNAEDQAKKEGKARADFEGKCKLLTSQLDNMSKELQEREEELRVARSDARKAEGQRSIAVQEAKDTASHLEAEKSRLAQALEREERGHKELLATTEARNALERELAQLRAKLKEAEERLELATSAGADAPKLRAMAEGAEAKAQRLASENAAMQSVVASLQEELKDLRASEAKSGAKLAAAEADAKRFKMELDLAKPQIEEWTNKTLTAQSKCEEAESEARMAKLALKPLQQRLAAVEEQYAEVRGQFDDVASSIDRERLAKVAVEKLLQQATESSSGMSRDLSALQEKLRERDSAIASLEASVKDAEPQLALIPAIKAKILSLASENRDLLDQVEEFKSENSRLILSDRRTREELGVAISKVEELQRQINAGKMEEAQKLADMERRINEDVYFLTHERDHYKTELNRYYGLPNPVGVGMAVEETIEKLPTGGTATTKYVKAIVPGLSADLSGVIRKGDFVLSVDGVPTLGMTLDDLRTAIAGPRGSKVTLKFLREKAHDGILDGLEYTLVLKRGSWGPEHAVLAPEDKDMVDMGRWPAPNAVSQAEFKLEDINRHNITNAKGPAPNGLQEKQINSKV